ncbi:ferredoxin [Streptomyces thermodiastaticus]|jgi:ferredoxin|uniref:ferredoxin n=1 Tax=Streptomyces thermodiastaticus TaxID=44061 RepID=UPI0016749241|nr:ferredoxin [Streptomyces thermodiastaticus]MCE7553334.1 ferredoxin [Streptomyces thermodiastaticus]GHF96259.1 ferredoxin [Streptomyces thermodiastaticus]
MRIEADTETCVGSGRCVLTEPAVFDQDDDGIVVLLTDRPAGRAAARARQAASLCPSRALRLMEP